MEREWLRGESGKVDVRHVCAGGSGVLPSGGHSVPA